MAISITFAVLLYFLIGVLFLIAYILAMKPQSQSVMLGLMVTFWPLLLLIDLILALSREFGRAGRALSGRIITKTGA